MKKWRLYICVLFILLVTVVSQVGCGRQTISTGQNEYLIYCLDRDENTHRTYGWNTDLTDADKLVDALIVQLAVEPDDVNLLETIRTFTVESYSVEGGQITINVSEEYRELEPTTEILVRGAIVRTLAQIDGIEKISIKVHGEELLDALGGTVGPMSSAQFVDNAGNEINSYEAIKLALYFADADGNKLKRVNRTLEYNTNISAEKLVVEQLIDGPVTDGMRACINPQTEVINVTIKDGIGYVSLSDSFLILPDGVSPDVAVYSIVNSLSELPGVNKVQISIDGETGIVFNDSLNLDAMFERNLDIVE